MRDAAVWSRLTMRQTGASRQRRRADTLSGACPRRPRTLRVVTRLPRNGLFVSKLSIGTLVAVQDSTTFHDQGQRVKPPVIIVSKALADKLFPNGDALGKQVYLDEDEPRSTIIGIVEKMQEPWTDSKDVENATFIPYYMEKAGLKAEG